MFTFSFSSAFAADVKTAEDYLNDAYTALSTNLNAAYTTAVRSAADDAADKTVVWYKEEAGSDPVSYKYQTTDVKFSAEAKVKAFADEKAFFEKVLEERFAEVLAGDLSTITGYLAAYSALDTAVVGSGIYHGKKVSEAAFEDDYDSATADWQKYLLKYAFEEAKEDTIDHMSRVDLSLYPDTVMDADDPFAMTHLGFATKCQADYLDDLGDIAVSSENLAAVRGAVDDNGTDSDYSDDTTATQGAIDIIAAKLASVAAIEAKLEPAYTEPVSGTVYTYKFVGETYTSTYVGATGVALATKDTLDAGAETLEAAKASALALAQSRVAAYKAQALSDYNDSHIDKTTLKAAQREADAYLAMHEVRIAEAKTTPISVDSFTFVHSSFDPADLDDYADVLDAYEDLEDKAAAAKLVVGEAGTPTYVASIIDKNLADAKLKVLGAANIVTALANAASIDVTEGAKKEESLEWAKKVALAQLAEDEEAALADAYGNSYYYELEAAKVAEAYDKVEAKINACTTVDQVKAIARTASLTGIDRKAIVETKIQNLVKFSGELEKINTYVTAQNMMNGATKVTDDAHIPTIQAADLAKFYAKNNARTNDEIVALLDKAKEWAAGTPTVKALKDQKAALEAQIEALPKLVKLTDKDAVRAAWEANDSRDCAAPKNEATLTADVNIIKGLEAAEIDKLIKALPAKITAADKAAVKAIENAIDAYDAEEMYGTPYAHATFDLDKAKAAVRDSEKEALEAAIAKLPENATAEQVNAVKAQFEAFVEEYTDLEAGYDAAAHVNNAYRLEYAEKLIAEKADENAKAYVQDLSIKARSTKTSKGVKVTIKADVQQLLDEGFTVEYKFYRSTKSNAKFGTAKVTKTTNTYLNTAGKKGTRYYYKAKLVVKNAAGEVVATTPLTQCLYATRVF